MKIETYIMVTNNGKHIRKATKVVFEDGREIKFTERMTRREVLSHPEVIGK